MIKSYYILHCLHFYFVAVFSEVFRFVPSDVDSSLTYSLYTSDAVFTDYFIVDGSNGAVYLYQSLAGRNISSTTATVKVGQHHSWI